MPEQSSLPIEQYPKQGNFAYPPSDLVTGLEITDIMRDHLEPERQFPHPAHVSRGLQIVMDGLQQEFASTGYFQEQPEARSAASSVLQSNTFSGAFAAAESTARAAAATSNLLLNLTLSERITISRKVAPESDFHETCQKIYEAVESVGGDCVTLPSLAKVIHEKVRYAQALLALSTGHEYVTYLKRPWTNTKNLPDKQFLQPLLTVFNHQKPIEDREADLTTVLEAVTTLIPLLPPEEHVAIRALMLQKWVSQTAQRTQELGNSRGAREQQVQASIGSFARSYASLCEPFKAPEEQLTDGDFGQFYRTLADPHANGYPQRQPLQPSSARWLTEGLRGVFEYAARADSVSELRQVFTHLTHESVAIESTIQRLRRLSTLPLSETVSYGVDAFYGPSSRLEYFLSEWADSRDFLDETLPDHLRWQLDFIGQAFHALPKDIPSTPLMLEPPKSELLQESSKDLEPSTDFVKTVESGAVVLGDLIEVTGRLSWQPLPSEKVGPRGMTGEDLSTRFRERYPRHRLEENRIKDFVNVCQFFDGEVWESFIGGPGAVHLFTYENERYVHAEWFSTGKAAYVAKYEGDDWEDLLRFHRRELKAFGAVQVIHPPTKDGEYVRGDHQRAILEAVEKLQAQRT